MNFQLILAILAAAFGLAGLIDTLRAARWASAGVLCLALLHLLGSGLLQ